MESLSGSLQAALAVAMATTFDDNIYLTGFFSETNRSFRPVHVIAGELLGFTVLIGSSYLISRILSQSVPESTTGWLGVVPIGIGFFNLVDLIRSSSAAEGGPSSNQQKAISTPQRHGYQPSPLRARDIVLNRRTYAVSAITISNGGNNLAIYIPLLGNSSVAASLLTIFTCYLAVGGWLLLSFRLTRLPGIAMVLSRHASRIFPFVLIWLGFRILSDTGVLWIH